MNAPSVPAIVMASVSVYVGLYHLLNYLRRRQQREDLTFALLSLATGLYAAFCARLYGAASVAEGAEWQRAQFMALAAFVVAFLWFVSDYTHQKPTFMTYAFSAFYLVAFVIQAVDRSGLTWMADRPSIKPITLPFGLTITYYEAEFGPFTTAQSLMGLAASLYILWTGVRYSRRGHAREARPLLLALGFLFAAAVNDTAVSNGWYQFIYTIEYSYMAMILLMAYALSSAVVEAAATKDALRESEERFRSLVETTSDWVWEVDGNGVYTYASPKSRDLLGYGPEEIVGKTPFDLMPAEDADRMRAVFMKFLALHRTIERLENVARHKDGRLVVLETSGVPVLTEDGKLLGYRGIDRDITERKRAEEALRENEEKFRSLVENALAGIFTIDDSYRFIYCNDKMSELLGYPKSELLGMDFRETLSNESKALVADQYIRRQRGERLPPRYEIGIVRSDGEHRHCELSATVVKDPSGKPRTMGQLVDITERKRAEKEIRRLNAELELRVEERTAQLEAANKELEAFAYSVSHDLRAPLRAIDGFSGILIEDFLPQLPSESGRYLTLIRQNSQRMGHLIDHLLDFSRLSRQPLVMESVSHEKLVIEALESLKEERRGRNVEIAIGELPSCPGDPTLLRQVWLNLLANALKFTRKRDAVKIEVGCRVDAEGKRVYFVKDNGAGFDMKYARKLFGVFQRLHRANEYEGTGVGLAIVHRIIHRHGGRIWAEAKAEEGAAFYFML